MTVYADRDALKQGLSIAASATANNAMLDTVLETVSRMVDQYVGFPLYPRQATRYFTPSESDCLYLGVPLLAVTALQTASDNGSTFGTTLSSGDYYLLPYNATEESPRQPWWEIAMRPNSTGVFLAGADRSARITGTWGYFDEYQVGTTATLSTGLSAGSTSLEVTGATGLHPGQTIKIGSEWMLVRNSPTSSTGSNSSTVGVARAVNGSSAASAASGAAISIQTYPIIDRAVLLQAEMDYRAMDAPLGYSGGEPFGDQTFRTGGAQAMGMHPFLRRTLDAFFRKPVAV